MKNILFDNINKILNFNNLKRYLDLNTFFLILTTGIFFLSNLIIYETIDQSIYKKFGLICSFIALQITIGALGFEQLIIRKSEALNNSLKINFYHILGGLIANLITSTILTSLVEIDQKKYFLIWLVFFLVGLNMMISKVLILIGSKKLVTLTVNSWKIAAAILILNHNIIYFLWTIIFFGLLTSIFSIYICYKHKITFDRINIRSDIKLWLTFLLSLASLAAISNLDKILIFKNLDIDIANQYFLFTTIFGISTIFQNLNNIIYIHNFKTNISLSKINEVIKNQLPVFLSTSIASIFLIFLLVEDFSINSFFILISLIMVSKIKLNYSILSSYVGGHLKDNNTIIVNCYNLMLLISYLILFQFNFGLPTLLIFIVSVWILRYSLWKKITKRQLLIK